MIIEAKNVLIRSLKEHANSSPATRKQQIDYVKTMLVEHAKCTNAIGMGFADHYIEASPIFLVIAERYPQIIEKFKVK